MGPMFLLAATLFAWASAPPTSAAAPRAGATAADDDLAAAAAFRALSRLGACCRDAGCREAHLSGLASALWNFGAADDAARAQARDIAARCGLRTAVREHLALLREECDHGGSCTVSRAVFEFHARRYGVVADVDVAEAPRASVLLPKAFTGNSVGKALKDRSHGWTPEEPFRIVRRGDGQDEAVPSAAAVDASLVVGWAAMRAGLPIALWSDRALMLAQVRAMRPHYGAYTRWFQQPPSTLDSVRDDDVGNGDSSPDHAAVDSHSAPPALLGTPRDLVWMIMHVVYVEAEFGLWQLSAVQFADLEPELRFLNGCLTWAIAADDFDMLGELLDCLRCAELPTSRPSGTVSGGRGPRSNVRDGGNEGATSQLHLPSVEMEQAMVHLVSRQNADGSWGDPESQDAVHIAHVCGLALLSRRYNRLRQRKDEGMPIGVAVPNAVFWETASQVMAEGGKDDEM